MEVPRPRGLPADAGGGIATLILAVGCRGEIPTAARAAIAGTWHLESVNGRALPYVLGGEGENRVELVSDRVELSADGRFTEVSRIRYLEPGFVSTNRVTDDGTYSVNGDTLTLRYGSDRRTDSGAVRGEQLTLAGDGYSLVYRRE
ncbi:MAG TPA: lipocalin family protein [Gemmatimonadaceae bacterium]|nr:lipocalin family protein [Gemmatimonadaceae bacterium]